MTVTAAQGFLASGVTAGIKESPSPDLALVVNRGPSRAAAGVFTSNRVQAAPVRWSRRVLADRRVSAVVLNSVRKTAAVARSGWTVGGMAKGAGMLAPGLATMLVVLTTDADADDALLDSALRSAVRTTFDRVDSDRCMSTNDTVLLLASGASGEAPDAGEFTDAVHAVCGDLARQLVADAEGASKEIEIEVVGAATEHDAVTVGRSVARNNLLKCALHGEDPNWGRVLSAIGTTDAVFDPDRLDVAINGVWVCRDGAAGEPREKAVLSGRRITVTVDVRAGDASAVVRTNDLTAEYVHENSAYSS
ncbi:bifunctional ornithine acetyltransferase/N-acetylglutamate synthase [Streptomyces sp. NPDC085466]|uniref:bifunctional ornithine acetyltransferase/N-acetylglutamate synthase n=1 Tax=Streptomyces sp. NPDC085466 TaxID=3365725 RepID=UPI0037D5565C